MALINCPECSKEVSDMIKSCPNCGYKIKKSNTPVYIAISIVTLLLLLVIVGGAFYLRSIDTAKKDAKNVIKSIDKISDDIMLDYINILEVNEKYNNLSSKAKKYVSNYNKLKNSLNNLENFEIKVKDDNILEFFNIEITRTNIDHVYRYDSYTKMTMVNNKADFNIKVFPKKSNLRYEDISFELEFNFVNELGAKMCKGYTKEITLNEEGKAEYNIQVNDEVAFVPFEIICNKEDIDFYEVKGYIKLKY